MDAADRRRLALAVELAAEWHGTQVRKGTSVPYVSHLLQVAGSVLEHGGDADLAVAALLHDTVEDTDVTLADIEERFGPRVAGVVADCTDTLPGDTPGHKSPWRERKHRHLEHLGTIGPSSALVLACDKHHNLSSLVADARSAGVAAISPPRFSAEPADQLWYYTEAVDRLGPLVPSRLATALEDLVGELDALVAAG